MTSPPAHSRAAEDAHVRMVHFEKDAAEMGTAAAEMDMAAAEMDMAAAELRANIAVHAEDADDATAPPHAPADLNTTVAADYARPHPSVDAGVPAGIPNPVDAGVAGTANRIAIDPASKH